MNGWVKTTTQDIHGWDKQKDKLFMANPVHHKSNTVTLIFYKGVLDRTKQNDYQDKVGMWEHDLFTFLPTSTSM